MTRWRSPRQRRDAARRRRDQDRRRKRDQDRRRKLLEQAESAGPVVGAELLGQAYGVYTRAVPSRRGPAFEACGDGWRVMGSLAEVRAELEHRAPASIPAA